MAFNFHRKYFQLNRDQLGTGQSSEIELLDTKPSPYSSKATKPAPSLQYSAVIGDDGEFGPSKQPRRPTQTRWNPPFFNRVVLAGFALLFALFIGSLQAIYSYSLLHQGLATTEQYLSFLWTFGPTAIFVIVTALWRQVDYAAKNIQPWADLAHGPVSAEKSLLLDYQTPIQLVSLWKSLRNGHLVVASSIAIFIALKVLTIVSTGLMSLQQFELNGIDGVLTARTQFDPSKFNATAVDGRAANAIYGHDVYNMSFAWGTSDEYVAQITSSSLSYDAPISHTGLVDVFNGNLVCQTGKLTYTNGTDHQFENTPVMNYYNTSVSLPDCQIYNARLDAPDWYYLQNDTKPRFGYWGLTQNVTCSNLPATDPTRQRYMVAVAYSRGQGQNRNMMLNSSNIVCIPGYTVQKADATYDDDVSNALDSVQPLGNPTSQFAGVSNLTLGQSVFSSIEQMVSVKSTDVTGITDQTITLDPFLELLVVGDNGFQPENLLDTRYLETQSKRVYAKVAAQVVNMYMVSGIPDGAANQIPGSLRVLRNQLVVNVVPTRIMQGISGVMLFLCLFIFFSMPRGVVPNSPSSIANAAAILARSPELANQLRETGHLNEKHLAQILAHQNYMTVVENRPEGPTFSIKRLESYHHNPSPTIPSGRVEWFRPLVLRRTSILLTIFTCIAGIVVLEVLIQQSGKDDSEGRPVGLGQVYPESLTRYAWNYIPTLVLALFGTLFNVIDFELEFSDAYYTLAKGFHDAKTTILSNLLRFFSIHTTFEALRYKKFAVAVSSFTTLLAPFLTIFVSGLFFAQPMATTSAIEMQALDWFNKTGNINSSAMTQSFPVPGLIWFNNMSYPQWTYDEYALPKLEIPKNSSSGTNLTGSVQVNTPAIRAALLCSPVPESQWLNVTIESSYLNLNISTPDNCGNAGFISTPSIWYSRSISVPVNSSGYFGEIYTLPTKPPCPRYALSYGYVNNNQLQNFSLHFCSSHLEKMEVPVIYYLPGFTQGALTGPPISSPTNFTDSYSQDVAYSALSINGATDKFDPFFTSVVYGEQGIPAKELLNNTKLLNSVVHLYRQYAAQVVSAAYRTNLTYIQNQTDLPGVLPAYFNDHTTFRLYPSFFSTRALEGLLAILAICAILLFLLADVRKTLPKKVGSIAATASLLAGSKMISPTEGVIPPGAEWWSEKDWKRNGVLNNHSFRMGWWDDDQQLGSWMNEIPTGYMEGGDNPNAGRRFRIDMDRRQQGTGLSYTN